MSKRLVLAGGQRFKLPGLQTIWQQQYCKDKHYPNVWPCPEDELGWLLFKSCILDFLTSKFSKVVMGEFARFRAKRKQDMSKARGDFDTPEYVIQVSRRLQLQFLWIVPTAAVV